MLSQIDSLPFQLHADAEALIVKDQLMCVLSVGTQAGCSQDELEHIWAASGIYDTSRRPLTFTPRLLRLEESNDG